MADTQVLDGIYKEFYEDFVAEQVNNRTPLKDLWRFEEMPYGGREVVYAAKVGRNVSPFPTGEGSAFADAGSQKHVQVRVTAKKLMARIELTREALADSARSEFAFKNARRDEMDGLIDDIARRVENLLCLDGRGVLAHLNGDPGSSTTVELKNPGGVTGNTFGNRYVQVGMYVGAVDPATGQLRSGIRKVIAANPDGTDITIDQAAPAAWADGDWLVQAANASVTDILDTSYENAFWGILALIDDGTYRNDYCGVDRSQFSAYQAYVKPSAGAYSVDLIQQASDVVDQKLGGQLTDLLMHHSVRRLYLQALDADRRYTGERLLRPDEGTAAIKQGDVTLGEVPIHVIRDFPFNTIVGLDRKASGFVCYVSEKGKWVDEDGSVLVRVGTGSTARDKFEAWYVIRKQFHAKSPGKNFRIDGITGASIVVVRAE